MTRSGFIIRRIAALLFVAAVFFTASGFTFSPSVAPDFYAYVEFNVDGSGNLTSTTENLTLPKPSYYSGSYTAEGKTGVVGAADWQQHLFMQVDKEKFKDVHQVKVTVEWYDAAGQPEGNYFTVKYPNTTGSYSDAKTNTNGAGRGTKQWVTTETIIRDINFAKTEILGQGANIEVYVPKGQLTNHNTTETTDDYYGVAVHSVKIEPLEESYRLEQLETAAARWQAGEERDVSENITMTSNPTATRTITDAKGVTMTGKAFGTSSIRQVNFMLDKEKFADASTVNLTVKWFDAKDSQERKNNICVDWNSTVFTQDWHQWLKETPTTQGGLSGEWKTSTYTLTECDFKDETKNELVNFFINTNKVTTDMGTPDDPSDDVCGMLISEVTVERIPEWSFGGLKFTDETGGEIKELNAGGEFRTELTVNRTGGSGAADATLIVALMDENNKIERIAAWQTSIEPNQSKPMQVSFQNPEDVTGKTVRVMVWDSFTGLNLISNLLTCS